MSNPGHCCQRVAEQDGSAERVRTWMSNPGHCCQRVTEQDGFEPRALVPASGRARWVGEASPQSVHGRSESAYAWAERVRGQVKGWSGGSWMLGGGVTAAMQSPVCRQICRKMRDCMPVLWHGCRGNFFIRLQLRREMLDCRPTMCHGCKVSIFVCHQLCRKTLASWRSNGCWL